MKKILVYGYGNPGRQDDGLGVSLAKMIEVWGTSNHINNITVDTNYQLNIEDAYNLNLYDYVIFIDATKEAIDSYLFNSIAPVLNTNFTMHAVSPGFVLGLCKELYQQNPPAYVLGIKGYEWKFMAELSKKAEKNLNKAFTFLTEKIIEFSQ